MIPDAEFKQIAKRLQEELEARGGSVNLGNAGVCFIGMIARSADLCIAALRTKENTRALRLVLQELEDAKDEDF